MVVILGSSKALLMFEDDPRFLAVEKDREREELFEDYMVDLERKVRSCGWNVRMELALAKFLVSQIMESPQCWRACVLWRHA